MSTDTHTDQTGALVFDIKRYAVDDGPGIRTTIFLKGCPLRCVWCHNPEGWSERSQLLYKRRRCIGCQTCIGACRQQALRLTPDGIVLTGPCRESADQCADDAPCAEACPTKALELCGRHWTMEALMREVEKERDVMEDSGGGVTLCGGEPLMHPAYTLRLLGELGRRGLHRCVDTTLYASPATVEAVAGECELVLADLKMMDPERHRRYTGVDNTLILDNLRLLARKGHPMQVRIPLIEGVNADDDNIGQTARFLASLQMPGLSVRLLPYHDMGRDKHCRMWSTYNAGGIPMATPSQETMARCRALMGKLIADS